MLALLLSISCNFPLWDDFSDLLMDTTEIFAVILGLQMLHKLQLQRFFYCHKYEYSNQFVIHIDCSLWQLQCCQYVYHECYYQVEHSLTLFHFHYQYQYQRLSTSLSSFITLRLFHFPLEWCLRKSKFLSKTLLIIDKYRY